MSTLRTTCHIPLEPPPELLELRELLEPPESRLLPLCRRSNRLTKTHSADRTDGIALTSLKDIPFTLALMTPAVTSVMAEAASGTSTPTPDLAEEIVIVLTSAIATLLLTAETPTTGFVLSTHVVELLEFAFLYVLNKQSVNLGDTCIM